MRLRPGVSGVSPFLPSCRFLRTTMLRKLRSYLITHHVHIHTHRNRTCPYCTARPYALRVSVILLSVYSCTEVSFYFIIVFGSITTEVFQQLALYLQIQGHTHRSTDPRLGVVHNTIPQSEPPCRGLCSEARVSSDRAAS